ncbi:hypothetical protein ES692_12560 [Psychroserpens burtonensis]|uniref:Uncharacterized protein n=1 Tax=Psychroserpens burtonensis TaxID=49278 RepID=A0A5C7B6N9_9FLAO|nr:hypothetical protein [Psychroserpens burtonensis]TXE16601.1 hypothetical protein ES692_12560 [Psychroserpens burtonensis]
MNNKKSITEEEAMINFRLSKVLKETIITEAQKANITSSKYLRNLLEEVHSGNYCLEEKLKSERENFLFSKEFLQLMIWIYRKRENNKREVEKQFLERYIKTLKRTEDYLPNILVYEFDKILKNLLLVRVDTSYDGSYFDFHKAYNEDKKFNFEIVEKFLLDENVLIHFIEKESI